MIASLCAKDGVAPKTTRRDAPNNFWTIPIVFFIALLRTIASWLFRSARNWCRARCTYQSELLDTGVIASTLFLYLVPCLLSFISNSGKWIVWSAQFSQLFPRFKPTRAFNNTNCLPKHECWCLEQWHFELWHLSE